jgi:selenocysteine-specific elongation factor
MIIGTAGHIDHGKTMLVKALTGVETDRLKEEKARGITIELGFAYVPLPTGGVLGFVDVPGHERFVHTMLAGAASVDFAMLVVAADDGVMPQTREHLQIIDLLGIREGLVVLNKADLVDDERRAEVESQIRDALQGSGLSNADILPVSALTGAGVDALRDRLLDEAASRPEKVTGGIFRMSIDRSFTVAGAGTVVTGGVVSGSVAQGDRVVALPSGSDVRVRTLHAQGREAQQGVTGDRCALNLAGIEKVAVGRGHWLVDPKHCSSTTRVDVELRLLGGEDRPLRSGATAHLHVGTSAVRARVIILGSESVPDSDSLAPGRTALTQLLLSEPLPLRFGDRFVLRDAAAERTIGGGSVIDPRAPQRLRRTPARLEVLRAHAHPDASRALAALLALPPGLIDLDAFSEDRGLSETECAAVLKSVAPRLTEAGGAHFAASTTAIKDHAAAVTAALTRFHAAHPDLPGQNPEALRLSLQPRLPPPMFDALLTLLGSEKHIVNDRTTVRLPMHSWSLGSSDMRLWAKIEAAIEAAPTHPPLVRELAERAGQPVATIRKLCKTMSRLGAVIEIAPDRFFLRTTLEDFGRAAEDLSKASPDGTFSVAQFRDRVGSGRQLGIQVLEYFDRQGLTLRRGDVRLVVKPAATVFEKIARQTQTPIGRTRA